MRHRRWLLQVVLGLGLTTMGGTATISHAAPPDRDGLIARIEAILKHKEATPGDVRFLEGLSQADFDYIWEYYGAHPRMAAPVEELRPETVGDQLNSTQSWVGERIECGYGYTVFGNFRAGSVFHTAGCGGDADDHFYQYTSIPNAYADRSRLRGKSVDPRVLIALGSFGWGLSTRVYDNGYVLTCVGGGIHRVGLTHGEWNAYFALRKD